MGIGPGSSASDFTLETVQKSLDILTQKRILFDIDDALLDICPFSLCCRVKLGGADDINPCGHTFICLCNDLAACLGCRKEALHLYPVRIALIIIEVIEERADRFQLFVRVSIVKAHETIHNTCRYGSICIGRDRSDFVMDGVAAFLQVCRNGIRTNHHCDLACSEHILEIISGFIRRVRVGIAVLDQSDLKLNGFDILLAVQCPVIIVINKTAAIVPGIIGKSRLAFICL